MPLRSGAAKRYAEALAGLARQDDSWDAWRRDLAALVQAAGDEAGVVQPLVRQDRRPDREGEHGDRQDSAEAALCRELVLGEEQDSVGAEDRQDHHVAEHFGQFEFLTSE